MSTTAWSVLLGVIVVGFLLLHFHSQLQVVLATIHMAVLRVETVVGLHHDAVAAEVNLIQHASPSVLPAAPVGFTPAAVPTPLLPKTYTQPDGSTVGISPDGTAIPQPVSLLSRIANGDVDAIREALLTNESDTQSIAAIYAARLLNTAGTYEGGIMFLRTLPPNSLALVKAAYLNPTGLYGSDQAGYDVNRITQQTMYQDAWVGIEARLATPQ